jgi:hypothetical protein
MNGDPLLDQLRQFADKLAEKNISLVIGGGYGLLLRLNISSAPVLARV